MVAKSKQPFAKRLPAQKLARVASAQSKFDSTQVEATFLAAAVSKRLATRAPDRFLLHRHILGKDITVPLA